MSNNLVDLERRVMDMLLAGEHPILDALRRQFQVSTIERRELTGCGFFTYFSVNRSEAPSTIRKSLRIGDVDAAIPGLEHGAGFVLFVEDGYLDNLEGYTYDEPWPPSVSGFQLKYTAGTRNMEELKLDSEAS